MNLNHNRIKVADLERNQQNKILTTGQNGELEFTDINDIKIDSYNALDYVTEGKSLDARQGKILKDLIDNINTLLASDNVNLNTLQELVDAIETIQNSLNTILVNDLTSGGTAKALTAEMGKLLQNNKVDKVTGKNLLSDTEITRLGTLSNYTHPANHPPGVITQDTNNRFVTDTEKANWNAKQSLFTGLTNFITKSLNATTLISSRLFDNGNYFGIGTSKTPTKDITLGNQSNREIGIEESSNTIQGRDLIIAGGRTINYAENSNFNSLSQIGRIWMGMTWHTNGNVYAGIQEGDIFVRINGVGDFISLGQSLGSSIRSMGRDEIGNIYASGNLGIFKQTNGLGNFLPIPSPPGLTQGVSGHINGNVYACVGGESSIGDIYIQTGGIGSFVPMGGTLRSWAGICCHPNGNVYASAYGNDIYMQTNGTGPFIALGQGPLGWHQISCHQNGNVYVVLYAGDIYMQINGTGPFISLGQGTADRRGLTTSSNKNVYVSVIGNSIFMQQNDNIGKQNLQGGTLKLKSGTGKGTGQSRIEFNTGQKTVSGTDMQLETLRAYIDENGYMVWTSMPTYPDNTAAIAGGLPIGCEYKTATGQRMIVY